MKGNVYEAFCAEIYPRAVSALHLKKLIVALSYITPEMVVKMLHVYLRPLRKQDLS